ncbi:MAG: universal stress protein [Nitrosopumilus sp.]|jgi:nucleotide-binding universal stress UspA family protein|nr:universal stress protein [Nitrosopumilus sp.]MDH3501017.1 universal stress protein [Nitrosopumilus sp.]
MNIKKILVPLDGSKNSMRGLDEAIYLARQCHATITGLYVIPLSKPKTDSQISYIEKYLLGNASKFMLKAKKRAAQNGIDFFDDVTYGDEGVKIINYANSKKFDIIVIGSRGMSSIKETFLGSTSNYVLHKSKIPVLIIK